MMIYSFYGFNDFIICLGYKGDMIKNYFYNYDCLNNDFTVNFQNKKIEYHTDNNETNWKVTLVDTGINTLKGGRIKRIEKYLDSEINMLTYGDGVGNIDIKELLKFHQSHNKIVTITGVYPPSLFGEILEEDEKVVSFKEKPQTSKGLINGGFMVFNRKMLGYFTEDENCDFEFGGLEKLVREGQVMVYKHQGPWACVDTQRDLEYLNKLWEPK
ncbi:unnamed protein product [marine sediment metagenome]|uniref:Nucleotidyl transferase domain-containing protein n=1 Tax=marine sediment metagenome TaxID=412755 RepID=X1L208_9ZZZZ